MIKLKEEENILMRVERSCRAYYGWFAFAAILAAADFLLLFWLLQFNDTGWMIFAGILLCSALIAWRANARRSQNILLVTDQRVIDIDKKGLFQKEISELTLDLVEDVTVRQSGPMSSLLKIGVVSIIGSHGRMKLEFKACYDPVRVQESILDAREALMDTKRFGATGAHLEAHNRLPVLMREIKMLSYKQLTRLKEAVDARMKQYKNALDKRKDA